MYHCDNPRFPLRNSSQPFGNLELKFTVVIDMSLVMPSMDLTQTCYCSSVTKIYKTKYLGVIVDQRLSWYYHLDCISSRIIKLVWIFKTLRHVTTKILLNKTYIEQFVAVYCIPVWGGLKDRFWTLCILSRIVCPLKKFTILVTCFR